MKTRTISVFILLLAFSATIMAIKKKEHGHDLHTKHDDHDHDDHDDHDHDHDHDHDDHDHDHDHDDDEEEHDHEHAEENIENLPELEIEHYDLHSFMNSVVMSDFTLVLHLDATKEEENQKYDHFFEEIKPELYTDRPGVISHLGRITAEEELKVPKEFKTKATPAFIFYDHSRPFVYTGPLDEDEFLHWIDDHLSRELTTLKSQEDLDKFIAGDSETKIVAFYESKKKQADEIEVLTSSLEHNYLARNQIRHVGLCLAGCPTTYKNHTFKRPSLAIFRSWDAEQPFAVMEKDLKEFTTVNNWISAESLPPILVFDEINQTRVFDEAFHSQIYIIVDPAVDNKAVLETFAKHSLKNRHEHTREERFVHVEYEYTEETRGLRWLFGNQSVSTLPKLFITEATVELDQINKYEFPKGEKITIESIEAFIAKYRNKQLDRYYISEEIPTDNEGKAVKRLVGRTFSQEVLRSPETSVVFVCANMDDEVCSKKFERFENVAKRIVGFETNKKANVKFSYIDVAHNEASVNQLENFPHIMLLKEGQKKDQKPFKSEFTEDELFKWIIDWVPKLKPTRHDDEL